MLSRHMTFLFGVVKFRNSFRISNSKELIMLSSLICTHMQTFISIQWKNLWLCYVVLSMGWTYILQSRTMLKYNIDIYIKGTMHLLLVEFMLWFLLIPLHILVSLFWVPSLYVVAFVEILSCHPYAFILLFPSKWFYF